jgi:predicted DNA-binding protein
MTTQTVRLPEDLAQPLERIARSTRRTKTSFIIEALELYLKERENLETALARVREPQAEYLDHAEVKRALDLDEVGAARVRGARGVAEGRPAAARHGGRSARKPAAARLSSSAASGTACAAFVSGATA